MKPLIPIIQFDLNLNEIDRFSSIKEASEKTNISQSLISKYCRGKHKSKNYIFRKKCEVSDYNNNQFKFTLVPLNKPMYMSNLVESGIENIFIYQDDWIYKNDIVKSIILNKIGQTKNRIFARKCTIKEITDVNVVRNFLEKNHLQGFVGSNIKIGLYHSDELVSIMTFGQLRRNLGHVCIPNHYELLRFCNVINTIVIGGSSKLLKYFIKKYKPDTLISYSDLSRSNGNMYKKLGFSPAKKIYIGYYWIVNGIRRNRFLYRKDKLVRDGFDPRMTEVEIMTSLGYHQIFDLGSQKWIYTLKP